MEDKNELWKCAICKKNKTKKNDDVEHNNYRVENELLKDLITELKRVNELQREKIVMLESQIEKLSMDNEKKTYSQILKKPSEAIIVVKPTNAEKKCNITKEIVKKNIDPYNMKMGISKLKNISNGGVVIGCENKNARDELQTALNTKLSDNYCIEIPQAKLVKIKISLVDKNDTDEVNFEEKIKKQNEINDNSIFKVRNIIERKRRIGYGNNDVDIIAEVDKELYDKLMGVNRIKVGWRKNM